MKRGRMWLAAARHFRGIAGCGLAWMILVFCEGCMATFHSTKFDVPPKSPESVSATNFRLVGVVDKDKKERKNKRKNQHKDETDTFSNNLRMELQKLEKQQKASLVAVPYNVEFHYRGYEGTSDEAKIVRNLLWLCSAFVIPTWESDRWLWDVSTVLPGETVTFNGEQRKTEVIGWAMLPVAMQEFPKDPPRLSTSMAQAVFDSLTEERYGKAIQEMRRDAKERLQKGEELSDADRRLLDGEGSLATLIAWAKHPADKAKSRDALRQIDDAETLADIAFHAAIPEIREAAASRVGNLPEARFAELAGETKDVSVGEIFLKHVSDDRLLVDVVEEPSTLPEVKTAAVRKIKRESDLADIAKATAGDLSLKLVAIDGLKTEAVLADVAVHAPVAEARKAAIGKLANPSALLAAVLNDAAEENRLAALERLDHPKALAAVMKKSGDATIRLQALAKISDPAVLKDVVAGDADEAVRLAALEKSEDQEVFRQAVETDASPAVRKAALAKLTAPDALAQVAKCNKHKDLRLAALSRVTDSEAVKSLATADDDADVRLAAIQKLDDAETLAHAALRDASADNRKAALAKITDQKVLEAIVAQESDGEVRQEAVAKLDNADLLASLARRDGDAAVRRVAVSRVQDGSILAEAALNDADAEVRRLAVERMDDQYVLSKIAVNDNSADVRKAAMGRLTKEVRERVEEDVVRAIMNRAKKAEERGLINVCGFYLGMPEEDFNILNQHYKSKGHYFYGNMYFPLESVRRITEGGNSFEELAQAVANCVGRLSWKREYEGGGYWDEYYEYHTINGRVLILRETRSKNHGPGLHILWREEAEPENWEFREIYKAMN